MPQFAVAVSLGQPTFHDAGAQDHAGASDIGAQPRRAGQQSASSLAKPGIFSLAYGPLDRAAEWRWAALSGAKRTSVFIRPLQSFVLVERGGGVRPTARENISENIQGGIECLHFA
jgi:hypothetical protein